MIMLSELLNKYRNDRLTPDELTQMRRIIEPLDDEELATLLDEYEEDSATAGEADITEETIRRIREHCFEEAGLTKQRQPMRWLRPAAWAAAAIIPALIAVSAYLFMQNNDYRRMTEADITVMTGEGERVTTILPDGSKVELNYMSELSYSPSTFNMTQRRIRFSGEGFFTVTRNETATFTIDASGLEVIVRGTTFNLHVRQDEELASLYLDKGCVDLRTSQQNVRLTPGQLASVNRTTGRIDVTDTSEALEQTAWRTGFLRFNNRPIDKVINVLSSNYGYRISLEVDSAEITGRFTGHIPANNLNEALGILEYAYHLKAHIDGRTITLTK